MPKRSSTSKAVSVREYRDMVHENALSHARCGRALVELAAKLNERDNMLDMLKQRLVRVHTINGMSKNVFKYCHKNAPQGSALARRAMPRIVRRTTDLQVLEMQIKNKSDRLRILKLLINSLDDEIRLAKLSTRIAVEAEAKQARECLQFSRPFMSYAADVENELDAFLASS